MENGAAEPERKREGCSQPDVLLFFMIRRNGMPPEGGARTAGSCWKERGTNLWFVLDLSAAVRQQKERDTNRWFVPKNGKAILL